MGEDPDGIRPKVVATLRGTEASRNLILNGHCDVVPVPEPQEWNTGSFRAVEMNGNIYGRGASDM